MTVVVSSNQFKQMQSYKTLEINQKERQKLKWSFIDRIKSKINIRWNRAKKVLSVIDEIIYKATDRGYSFNGRETLADKCKVSLSTVDKAIKLLKQSEEVFVAYRHNPASNGYKTPIIILKQHDHFTYWNELLGLENSVENKVENTDTSIISMDEGVKKVLTYSLPDLKTNNNHLNTKRSPYIQFVPKSLQHFQVYFGKQVKDIYSRVWLAAKKLEVVVDQSLMQRVGFIAMNQLKQYIKVGKQFTDEELYKIAYTIGLNQLQQHFERQDDSKINESENNQIVNPYVNRELIRNEIKPYWMDKDKLKDTVTPKKTIPAVSEERKKQIWEQVNKLNAGGSLL